MSCIYAYVCGYIYLHVYICMQTYNHPTIEIVRQASVITVEKQDLWLCRSNLILDARGFGIPPAQTQIVHFEYLFVSA